jgi:hypothetical protein
VRRAALTSVRRQVPIIEGHPTDARLAMTAGYDGNVVVWDIVAGAKLARCAGAAPGALPSALSTAGCSPWHRHAWQGRARSAACGRSRGGGLAATPSRRPACRDAPQPPVACKPRPAHVLRVGHYPTRAARAARSFTTADTRPDGRVWPEPIQLVDGHWAPDGAALAVADVAGQWHLYAASGAAEPSPGRRLTSPPAPSLLKPAGLRAPAWAAGPGRGAPASNARYDQFFASDYGPLSRDAAGFVLDAETQRPPHARSGRCAGLRPGWG